MKFNEWLKIKEYQLLIEEGIQEEAKSIIDIIKGIGPKVVSDIINKLGGAADIDELLRKLAESSPVKQFITVANQAKQEHIDINEINISSIFSTIAKVLEYPIEEVIKLLGKSILKTFLHVNAPFIPQALHSKLGIEDSPTSVMEKIRYAAILMLTFYLGLFALGGGGAGVGLLTGVSLSWWFMEWFAVNFLKPALQAYRYS